MPTFISQFRRGLDVVKFSLVMIVITATGAAFAADSSGYKLADGVLIYYAVLPAEMIRAYARGSPEARMHGGVPRGKHVHHIQIALFDAQTDERITDARVTARINEVGLPGAELQLEPFLIGGALTYGNYFEFAKLAKYTIAVRLTRPAGTDIVETQFEYRHH